MPDIPYEELAFEPNRTPAERLGSIVGRRFVFSRDQWPSWNRLVSKFSWGTVIRAAEQCAPGQRFPNHVEAMCIQLAKSDQEAQQEPAQPRAKRTPEECRRAAEEFARVRRKVMGA